MLSFNSSSCKSPSPFSRTFDIAFIFGVIWIIKQFTFVLINSIASLLQFMFLLILRHTLPVILSGTNEFSFPLFMVKLRFVVINNFSKVTTLVLHCWWDLHIFNSCAVIVSKNYWNSCAHLRYSKSSNCSPATPSSSKFIPGKLNLYKSIYSYSVTKLSFTDLHRNTTQVLQMFHLMRSLRIQLQSPQVM